jgi:polygalacturonase
MNTPIRLIAGLAVATCFFFGQSGASSGASRGCAPPPTSSFLVSVKDRGARGDGQTDDTNAIQSTIDEVAKKGGTVLVPNGTYMVSAVGDARLS